MSFQAKGFLSGPDPENIMFCAYDLTRASGPSGLGLTLMDAPQNKRHFREVFIDAEGFQVEDADAGAAQDASADGDYHPSSMGGSTNVSSVLSSPRRSRRARRSSMQVKPPQQSVYALPCPPGSHRTLLEFTGVLFTNKEDARSHTMRVTEPRPSEEILQLQKGFYMAPKSREGAWLVQHSEAADANAKLVIVPNLHYADIIKRTIQPPAGDVYAFLEQLKPIAPGDAIQFEYSHSAGMTTLDSAKPSLKQPPTRKRGRPKKVLHGVAKTAKRPSI